jgi:hypothetical protein
LLQGAGISNAFYARSWYFYRNFCTELVFAIGLLARSWYFVKELLQGGGYLLTIWCMRLVFSDRLAAWSWCFIIYLLNRLAFSNIFASQTGYFPTDLLSVATSTYYFILHLLLGEGLLTDLLHEAVISNKFAA